MKERPILFNDAMIRAILSGAKTQTRRICKFQPHEAAGLTWWPDGNGTDTGTGGGAPGGYLGLSPYGQPGERLWVREACSLRIHPEASTDGKGRVWYRAGSPWAGDDRVKWTPSIHMPRWASRILLEITRVRVERLKDISQSDAQAEGFEEVSEMTPYDIFASTWRDIYGHGSWAANPWVWVIEFKRVQA